MLASLCRPIESRLYFRSRHIGLLAAALQETEENKDSFQSESAAEVGACV